MGAVGMGLYEIGLPRRDGRTPWASYLSYQPVADAQLTGDGSAAITDGAADCDDLQCHCSGSIGQ